MAKYRQSFSTRISKIKTAGTGQVPTYTRNSYTVAYTFFWQLVKPYIFNAQVKKGTEPSLRRAALS